MYYYLAPLEGITGYVYRNAYHQHFHAMDKYFTPFLSPNMHKAFKSKELNDVLPEYNGKLPIVPQLLTNNSEHFMWAVSVLSELGYQEVNLNLGCPARTVVSKGKGSGFLAQPEALNTFLEQIFSRTKMKISIKTRIGMKHPDEFHQLLSIYNNYPLEELIIHPRVQSDYYNNVPNYEVFKDALEISRNPVVYNGDLRTVADLSGLSSEFPAVGAVMLGRGILRNPGLIGECNGQAALTKEQLKQFHDQLYEDYQRLFSGERNVLFKMKELWIYLIHLFTNPDKYLKKIKKADKRYQYDEAIRRLFAEQNLRTH